MPQYKLAIIIPSWNCQEYIGEMLDSIIANSFKDWKCFVIDDQSLDNTLDIIRTFHNNDERIIYKVRDREPKGAQTCRNIGFELTEGAEYVIWFDADDIIAPYCLEQRVAYMDNHPELDFGIFPAKSFRDNIWEVNEYTSVFGYNFFEDTLKAMLNRTLPMVGWTNIYRRTSVKKYNLFWDTNIMSLQDSDWNIQAITKGCIFDYAEKGNAKIDYFYRLGMNGISNSIDSAKHGLSHLYYLKKLTKTIEFKYPFKYGNEIKSYYIWIGKKIKDDRQLFFKFILTSWFLWHPWFWIRIIMLHHYGERFERKLFPFLKRNEETNNLAYRSNTDITKKNITQ